MELAHHHIIHHRVDCLMRECTKLISFRCHRHLYPISFPQSHPQFFDCFYIHFIENLHILMIVDKIES